MPGRKRRDVARPVYGIFRLTGSSACVPRYEPNSYPQYPTIFPLLEGATPVDCWGSDVIAPALLTERLE
jgi:hypothetical protein